MRAASSKGAADLIALWPACCGENPRPRTWMVQAKRDGRLPRAEREQLIEIARDAGAEAVLAKVGPNGRGVEFVHLREE